MGRIRYVLFRISRLLPKQHRRPIILISSFLGLLIFFNVLLSLSHSPYLLYVQRGAADLIDQLQEQILLLIVFVCLLLGWTSWKYYKFMQAAISFGYIVLLILAVLPLLGA